MRRRFFILLLLALSSLVAHARVPEIRVLLDRVPQAHYRIEGPHRGFVARNPAFETSLPLVWPITVRSGRIYVDGTNIGESLTFEPVGHLLGWAGQSYRGRIQFVASDDQLLVINVVDVENYLRGVVPSEMMASWPAEALKAQAVAARTYTLASLDADGAYDICATIECQVYAGAAAENPRTDRAIEETRGLVLTYAGDLARTHYHSDSGGVLASSAEVWGNRVPYLAGRNDVSSPSPHRSWRHTFDSARLERLLSGRGHRLGRLTSIRITAYSESGRAVAAEFIGTNGRAVVAGASLTSLFRAAGLKSTRFTMTGPLTARGDGWGHGVGMSQYGARQLASAGYGFEQILHFYYPQTLLQALASSEEDQGGP